MRRFHGREIFDSKIEKPFRMIIGGGSGTGKTSFTQKLVNANHFSSPFDKIIYCYPDYLIECPVEFDQIVDYRPGLGDLEYFSSLPKNTLIIYDDLMNECGNSKDIMKLFSVIARKRQLSIIFLVQNLFDRSQQFRNIRLNASHLVMFNFHAAQDLKLRLLRDLGMQNLISKQSLASVFSKPYSYIMLDIHPNRQSSFGCITSNILNKNFIIFHKMEYIAIPESEFLKHFSIQEAKEGSVRSIKDEIEIRERSKKKRKNKKSEKSRKKRRKVSESTTEESETSGESEESVQSS